MLEEIALNESVLSMKLNSDNRAAFKRVIIADALGERAKDLRMRMQSYMQELVDYSWGATPQARAANKKLVKQAEELEKKAKSKKLKASFSVANHAYDINVNFAGKALRFYYNKKIHKGPKLDMDTEFHEYDNNGGVKYHDFGTESLTFSADHPMYKKYWEIRDEADALKEAHEVLETMLNTVFGKAKTLKAAVHKWPELSGYAPSILSACRELAVRPEDLNAKIRALKHGKKPAAEAIKVKAA